MREREREYEIKYKAKLSIDSCEFVCVCVLTPSPDVCVCVKEKCGRNVNKTRRAKLPDGAASLNLNLPALPACRRVHFACISPDFGTLRGLTMFTCIFWWHVQCECNYVNFELINYRLLLRLLLGSCLVELLEFGQRRNVFGGSAAAHSACGNCKYKTTYKLSLLLK